MNCFIKLHKTVGIKRQQSYVSLADNSPDLNYFVSFPQCWASFLAFCRFSLTWLLYKKFLCTFCYLMVSYLVFNNSGLEVFFIQIACVMLKLLQNLQWLVKGFIPRVMWTPFLWLALFRVTFESKRPSTKNCWKRLTRKSSTFPIIFLFIFTHQIIYLRDTVPLRHWQKIGKSSVKTLILQFCEIAV